MTSGSPPTPPRGEEEIGLLRIAAVLIRRWRLLVVVPLTVGAVVVAISFFMTPWFTATSSFVPEGRSEARLAAGLGSLAGLASQFGFNFANRPAESPRFYAKVAESRHILHRLLLTPFPRPGASQAAGDSASLLQMLQVGGRDQADSLFRGLRKLRRRLSTSIDNQTSVVTVSFQAPDPDLAAAVANRLVAYVNDFNSQARRSQAHERRRFVEQRVADGERALRSAEQELKTFYERNRSWEQSPQLRFEEGRLRRQVDIRQEVYLTLQREYEMARIEEVNDVPLLTLIDVAVPPVRRSWPRRKFMLIAALSIAGLACVVWILAAEYVDRARRDETQDYEQFAAALTVARGHVHHLFGRPAGRRASP